MASERGENEEETQLLAKQDSSESASIRHSQESSTSASTTSLILEGINSLGEAGTTRGKPQHELEYRDDEDLEAPSYNPPGGRPPSKGAKRVFWIVSLLAVVGWSLALVSFLMKGSYRRPNIPYNPEQPPEGSGRKVTLDEVLHGEWYAHYQEISWIAGAKGEDGLLLEENQVGKDYLVVEDVRNRQAGSAGQSHPSKILMKKGFFEVNGQKIFPQKVWPSPDLKWVLAVSEVKSNWRHSFTGLYWIIDVEKQEGQPLDALHPDSRVQLASWSPTSNAIAFTRDNNMYIRDLASGSVKPITTDGGPQHFCGIPDWVYEEEVYQTNSVTWWANDGQYIAYLKTDEAAVPEFPVQYFLSRPSGKAPASGLENYPEVRQIKYPKAGAPNPTVVLEFYDVQRSESFSVPIQGQFADDNRLIIEVLWAAKNQVLIRQTNRESDSIRIILIDVKKRTGKIVRTDDIAALDGGWVEPTQTTAFIPADPANGRPFDGYIDTVIHDNNDHLAYFSPLDTNKPVFLTGGDWEVVKAPSAVDLKKNLVYFTATKEAPTQRHVYSVFLNGTNLEPICPTDKPAYYSASFSKGAGYALLSNKGPDIPSQKIINTPSNVKVYEETVETNPHLATLAASHDLPRNIYSTVTIDGFTLQVVERRPPQFDESKKYPTLFYLYGGPGSQQVDRQFKVDFQAYIASNLGYLVVTVDGRGTGFIGRKARCSIRDDIGKLEARDQIETAKIWAAKAYVDADRLAIWGWSYGGFMTLKTLETDAGSTFQYGMAVAPVTDWRFYDSVYTERYMHTPQHNKAGYDSSAITNTSALNETVRFLVMHGTADDNVHTQNTLVLLDKLDLDRVENYDVHVFPDSDHSILFHNANEMVYRRLSNWLVNAFNGEWLRSSHPRPKRPSDWSRVRRRGDLDTLTL